MDSNFLICRNEVLIEGISVGQFESFKLQTNSRQLGATAKLVLPLYALGTGSTNGRATSRVRSELVINETSTNSGTQGASQDKTLIRPCAQVEVWCWYDIWSEKDGTTVASGDKIMVFSGFIEHVEEGFPANLYLQDNTFCLRFGEVKGTWIEGKTIQQIITDLLPVAQEAFDKERELLDFTRQIPRLTYSNEKQNVQAYSTPLSKLNVTGFSPHEVTQKLMNMHSLYGGVSDDFNLFVGAGTEKSTRAPITIRTDRNVISRSIVPVDGRFVDYDVKIVGVLKNGRKYTAVAGVNTTKDRKTKSDFEKVYAEPFVAYSTLDTVETLNKFADEMLRRLKQENNKGSIRLLLLPKLRIMDHIVYTDTVFPELSGNLYVLEYDFTADARGYYQDIKVTDQIFAL